MKSKAGIINLSPNLTLAFGIDAVGNPSTVLAFNELDLQCDSQVRHHFSYYLILLKSDETEVINRKLWFQTGYGRRGGYSAFSTRTSVKRRYR